MSMSIKDLTAVDIMTTEVLMAYEGWSIKRLSTFFIKNSISGAPVIASDHTLVGVITVTDIINFETKSDQEKSKLVEEVYAEFVGYNFEPDMIKQMSVKADEKCTVNQVMTKHVIQVEENMPITKVSEVMLNAGIHRVFVSNNGVVSGVISTTNILKAISLL